MDNHIDENVSSVRRTSEVSEEPIEEEIGEEEISMDEKTNDMESPKDRQSLEEVNEKYPRRLVDLCPYKIFLTFLYWLVFFSCGVGIAGIGITLTEYRKYLSETLPVGISTVSLVFLLRSLGAMLSGYCIGRLCDSAKNPTRLYHLNLHHILGGMAVCGLSLPLSLAAMIPFAPISIPMHFFIGIGENSMLISSSILPKALFSSNKMTASVVQGSQFSLATGAFLFPLLIGSTLFRYEAEAWVNVYVVYFVAYIVAILPFVLFFCPAPVCNRKMVEDIKRKRFELKTEKVDNNIKDFSSISSLGEELCESVNENDGSKNEDNNLSGKFVRIICCSACCCCSRLCKSSFFQKDIRKIREIWELSEDGKIEDSDISSDDELKHSTGFFQKLIEFLEYKRKKIHILRLLFILLNGLAMIMYNSQNKTFQNLIFLYSKNRGWNLSLSAYTTTVYFLSYTIARFFAVFVFLLAEPLTMIFVLEIGVVVNAVVLIIFQKYDFVIWLCVALAAFFNSPIFGAMIVLPRSFGIEPSALETSVILTSACIGAITPSLVSPIMEVDNFLFLVCVNVLSCFMIIVYYITFVVGTILQSRGEEK